MWDRVTISGLPLELPVTLAEAKLHCDIDYADHDSLITAFINSAVKMIDGPQGIGIACFTQTWQLVLDQFDCDPILLPGWPIQSITSVEYVDTVGATQTVSSDNFDLMTGRDNAYLVAADGVTWPATYSKRDAITIKYVVGQTVADIPENLKLAIRMLVGHWYENREASTIQMHEVPFGVEAILNQYRRGLIGA